MMWNWNGRNMVRMERVGEEGGVAESRTIAERYLDNQRRWIAEKGTMRGRIDLLRRFLGMDRGRIME